MESGARFGSWREGGVRPSRRQEQLIAPGYRETMSAKRENCRKLSPSAPRLMAEAPSSYCLALGTDLRCSIFEAQPRGKERELPEFEGRVRALRPRCHADPVRPLRQIEGPVRDGGAAARRYGRARRADEMLLRVSGRVRGGRIAFAPLLHLRDGRSTRYIAVTGGAMESEAIDYRALEAARAAAFKSALNSDWRDDGLDHEKLARSQCGWLMRAVAEAACDHAVAQHRTNPAEALDTIADFTSMGAEIVRSLRFALGADEREGDARLSVWQHRSMPLAEVRANRSPLMDRVEIESVAHDYINLPYRVPALDRLLVDVLVALELFAFADEVCGNKPMPGGGPSPMKLKPIRTFIFGQAGNLVFAVVIGLFGYGASKIGLFPESWLPGLWMLLSALFLLLLGVAIIGFPRFWLAATKARKQAMKLLEQMNGLYTELSSGGPISTKHILQRAQATAADGVSWPAPLYVLLDDINARTGRI